VEKATLTYTIESSFQDGLCFCFFDVGVKQPLQSFSKKDTVAKRCKTGVLFFAV
jgi:hypothetical protein